MSFKAVPQPKSPPSFCPWLSHSPWELTSSRLPFPHISGLHLKRGPVEAKCSPVQKCNYRMDQTSLFCSVWVQAKPQQKLRGLLTLESWRMPVCTPDLAALTTSNKRPWSTEPSQRVRCNSDMVVWSSAFQIHLPHTSKSLKNKWVSATSKIISSMDRPEPITRVGSWKNTERKCKCTVDPGRREFS